MTSIIALFIFPDKAAAQQWPPFVTEDADYVWPTNASEYFSATFAETRSAHFHAAVDIGTWGREGYDVYASRDGYLYRVGISPYGYGNIIYLKHDDGSFSLYAHLQDFNDEIRALVDSVRFQDYRHSFDEVLIDHRIRYHRGDIIGRTGSTGIGPPHLHFELRSPANSPFNPKLIGMETPDSVPPVFSALAVEPVGYDAHINGGKRIVTRRPSRSGNNFDFGTIEAGGEIGFAVNVYDQADFARNVYAVYELRMEVDGELFFHSKVDSFSFDHTRHMLIDRSWPLLRSGRGGFQRTYVRPGNKLDFYQETGQNGTLSLNQDRYDVRFIASDFYGNTSTATVRVVNRPSGQTEPELTDIGAFIPLRTPAVPKDQFPLMAFDWHSGWFSPVESTFRNVTVTPVGEFGAFSRTYNSLGPGDAALLTGRKIEVRADGFEPVLLRRAGYGATQQFIYPAHGITLTTTERSVFDSQYIHVRRDSTDGRDRIYILPDSEPLQRPYQIRIELPEHLTDDPKVAFYSYNSRRNSFDYMESRVDSTILTAYTNRLGVFEIRRDVTPPQVNRPAIWRRSSDGQWFASVRAFDLESGIDFDRVVFKVNDQRGIAEYDPFGDQIRFHLPGFTPRRGANTLSLKIPDRAGNITETSFTVNH